MAVYIKVAATRADQSASSDRGPVVVQCTCLAVSRKWLALGTSAGGLHLIQREGWKQRLILTHKVSEVSECAYMYEWDRLPGTIRFSTHPY